MRKEILILILMVIVGLGLRFYKLDEHSYRGTEVGTIEVASKSIPQLLTADPRSPFFRLILHGWMRLFSTRPGTERVGENEFQTRALSCIFGALVIIPLYFLARRLVNKRVGLISAYLACISPFYILISRMTADSAFSLFLASFSVFLFLYWIEEGRGFIWYVISTILMLYSGPLLFLILIGEWIYFGIRWQITKNKLKIWLIGQLSILALYSYGIIRYFEVWSGECQAFDRLPVVFGPIGKAIYAFYAFSLGETVLPWNFKIVWPAAFVFVSIFAFGLTRLKRKYRTLPWVLVFLLLPMAPIFTNRGAPEYCISGSIAYYILLAISIREIRMPISITAIVLITFFNIYSLRNLYQDKEYHSQSFTDDWRFIAQYAKKEGEGGIVVAYHGSFIWYYKNGTEEVLPHPASRQGENLLILDIRDPESTETRLQAREKVLFVHTPGSGVFSSEDKGIYEFKEWLDQNFTCIQSVVFFENEDYKIKRKLLRRAFPRFRVHVFIYVKGFGIRP